VGAGLYLSWDQTVRHSDALETSQYIFSRVLGINTMFGGALVVAEDPPQRAFSFFDIFRHIEVTNRRNPHTFPGVADTLRQSYSPHNPIGNLRALLEYEVANGTSEPILQPGIGGVGTDDPEGRLYISGSFGSEQGIVSVGGQPVGIEEWNAYQITCQIGPTDSGAVVVAIDGHASDPRQLTLWSGKVHAALSGLDRAPEKVDLHVEFRGDAQSSRILPGDEPTFQSHPAFRCIPETSKVESADESGVFNCGVGIDGNITISTPSPPTGAKYVDLGDDVDGFWFQSSGIALDSDTGAVSASVGFGVIQTEGVKTVFNCENTTKRTEYSKLEPSGAFTAEYSPDDYDISFDFPVSEGGITLSVFADIKAGGTPSNDDPR